MTATVPAILAWPLLAFMAAVVGLRVPGTGIVDVATTAKTMPDFPALWTALVAPGDAAEEAR